MLKQIFFYGSLIFTIITPTFFSFLGSWEGAIIAFLSGVFVAITSRVDDIVQFKAFGMEVRLREAITKAETISSELRHLALLQAKFLKRVAIARRFLGGPSFESEVKLLSEIDESLQNIGCEPDEIKDTDEDWVKGIELLYASRIFSYLNYTYGTPFFNDKRDLLDELSNLKNWNNVDIDGIDNILVEAENEIKDFYYDDKLKEIMNELKYFRETKKILDTTRLD